MVSGDLNKKNSTVDEVIIIEPDFYFLIKGTVNLQNKKIPSILTSKHSFHSVKLIYSIKADGLLYLHLQKERQYLHNHFYIFKK